MSDQARFEHLILSYKPITDEMLKQLLELRGRILDEETLKELIRVLTDDLDANYLNATASLFFLFHLSHPASHTIRWSREELSSIDVMSNVRRWAQGELSIGAMGDIIHRCQRKLSIGTINVISNLRLKQLDDSALKDIVTASENILPEIMILAKSDDVNINELLLVGGLFGDAIHNTPYSPLGIATKHWLRSGNRELLDCLLANGADIDARAFREPRITPPMGDRTALCLAAEAGNLECINFLIAAGADVNKSFGDAVMTPLFAAAAYQPFINSPSNQFDHSILVHPLLDNGADLYAALDKIAKFFESNFSRDVEKALHNLICAALKHSNYRTDNSGAEIFLLNTFLVSHAREALQRQGIQATSPKNTLFFEQLNREHPEHITHLFCKTLIHDCTNLATALMKYTPVDVNAVYHAAPHDTQTEKAYAGKSAIEIAANRNNLKMAKIIVTKIKEEVTEAEPQEVQSLSC